MKCNNWCISTFCVIWELPILIWFSTRSKNYSIQFISRSPATNNYYLAQPHGEIYGLDHSMERFQPMMLAQLRPETDIPGLYLSGQDVFVAGFMGKQNNFGSFLRYWFIYLDCDKS